MGRNRAETIVSNNLSPAVCVGLEATRASRVTLLCKLLRAPRQAGRSQAGKLVVCNSAHERLRKNTRPLERVDSGCDGHSGILSEFSVRCMVQIHVQSSALETRFCTRDNYYNKDILYSAGSLSVKYNGQLLQIY